MYQEYQHLQVIFHSLKIVHTNDSNTSINFPSLDTISFVTGGGTRLQVGPVGQLGIAGATYGNLDKY